MYSLLEEHRDGSWWYHPGRTFNVAQEATEILETVLRIAEAFEISKGDVSRSLKIIKHTKPFPQDMSRCTRDFVHFNFAGGYEFTLKEEGKK